MSISTRSRERADDTIERLRDRYGEFTPTVREGALSQPRYSGTVNRFEADGVIGGAGAWVRDQRDRVLLVRPRDSKGWVDPGRAQRAGESLEATARAAVSEQTGVEISIEGVRHAQLFEYQAEDRSWPPVYALNVLFDGEPTGERKPDAGDSIGAVDWWRSLPNTVAYEEMTELPFPATD
jgi:ADP-ribose pyrophosphatase YjhB (NUDIX family)